jgi:dTDP-4-dehydrorhamnose reductase
VRLLVTGAGGALGRDVAAAFADHEVVALDHAALDVADRERVLQTIGEIRPDAVAHTAACTDLEGCERDPDRAFAVNALAVRHVAEAADHVGAWLCHVSTDYVFDGKSPTPYVEWDAPNPLSVYGRSKLGGEHEVGERATIVRSSWLAGVAGGSFVRTILEAAKRGPLRVVDDEVACPTFTPDLAAMIRRLVTERRPGIHHVTNQGSASRYALAVEALQLAGLDAEVVPIMTAELHPPRPASRPKRSVLDNAALRLAGIPLLADYHEPLERLVKELIAR